MEATCRICGNTTNNTWYEVKEMMLGTGDSFRYFQCGACNCLQLHTVPDEISRYYPDDYYSFKASPEDGYKGRIKKYLQGLRHHSVITGKGLTGRLLKKLLPNRHIELENFKYARLKKKDKILDVGSGNGLFTYLLKNAGFSNIKGIDPFLKQDIKYANGLHIQRISLFDLEETGWDAVMFNHSFEHLDSPQRYLERVNQILTPKGICIIRIPTVSSEAWETYKEHWVQLDAPRHYFLFSVKSMELLAERCGFGIKGTYYESTAFQFIGSEQYRKGISLYGSELSYYKGNRNIFTAEAVNGFQLRAEQLNKEKKGDSIFVVLQKL